MGFLPGRVPPIVRQTRAAWGGLFGPCTMKLSTHSRRSRKGTFLIGRTISQYHILERLGAGGMGEVYLAEDLRAGRRVALKILPEAMAARPLFLERFRREARAAASLEHPNIVAFYAIEETGGIP